MIELKNVSFTYRKKGWLKKSYTEKEIFNDLNLNLSPGKIFGLIGPNGVGKTTLAKIILGVYPQEKGIISFNNKNYKDIPWNTFKKNLGFLSGASSKLFSTLDLEEQYDLYKTLYVDFDDELFNRLIQKSQLTDFHCKYAYTLSFGERIKFELALTLATKPSILILDEPTVGVDVIAIDFIRKEIKDYTTKNNCITLLTSHNLEDISSICDYGGFLHKGKITNNFNDGKILTKEDLKNSYLLLFNE